MMWLAPSSVSIQCDKLRSVMGDEVWACDAKPVASAKAPAGPAGLDPTCSSSKVLVPFDSAYHPKQHTGLRNECSDNASVYTY